MAGQTVRGMVATVVDRSLPPDRANARPSGIGGQGQ